MNILLRLLRIADFGLDNLDIWKGVLIRVFSDKFTMTNIQNKYHYIDV